MIAEILTDFPERFSEVSRVLVTCSENEYWEEIENHWFQKNRVVIKFKGRERPHEVEELLGGEVKIPEDQRVKLPKDSYFDSDLIGCGVVEEGELIGEVVELLKIGAGSANLIVLTPEEKEFMIPLSREFLTKVDIGDKKIYVHLPPELVELAVARKKGPGRKRGET